MADEGFDFLGFHFHKKPSKRTRRLVPYAWPSGKAMRGVRAKIRQQTERCRLRVDLAELVAGLNRVIRGGRNYCPRGQLHQEACRSGSVRAASAVDLSCGNVRDRAAMCGRRGMRRGFGGVDWSASTPQDGVTYRLACREVKVVGQPYEGKPHVRFEVAGGGNQDVGPRRHSLTLPADASSLRSYLASASGGR